MNELFCCFHIQPTQLKYSSQFLWEQFMVVVAGKAGDRIRVQHYIRKCLYWLFLLANWIVFQGNLTLFGFLHTLFHICLYDAISMWKPKDRDRDICLGQSLSINKRVSFQLPPALNCSVSYWVIRRLSNSMTTRQLSITQESPTPSWWGAVIGGWPGWNTGCLFSI